eukprot:scaffold88724_cov75-Phaeocystis_antarctica.AAC.3
MLRCMCRSELRSFEATPPRICRSSFSTPQDASMRTIAYASAAASSSSPALMAIAPVKLPVASAKKPWTSSRIINPVCCPAVATVNQKPRSPSSLMLRVRIAQQAEYVSAWQSCKAVKKRNGGKPGSRKQRKSTPATMLTSTRRRHRLRYLSPTKEYPSAATMLRSAAMARYCCVREAVVPW